MASVISKADMLSRVVGPTREAMASGKLPWLRPWGGNGGLPHNPLRSSPSKNYTGGINNILLMIASQVSGWSDTRWMGRAQIKNGGYSIRGLTNLKSTTIYIPLFAWRTITEDGEERKHAAYLQSWHRRLGEKPDMFVNAINDAWRALTWVRERIT